jgi:hypothetical protein
VSGIRISLIQGVLCISLATGMGTLVSCNPFSPPIDANISQKGISADSVNGFFEIFREAYQFKDTTVYGRLLAPNFVFSYRNYDRGLDLEWGRDEEMQATGSLFASSEALDLLWGAILDSIRDPSGNDTTYDITRAFSLNITLNSSEILHTDGRATFKLRRQSKNDPWQAIRWRDESNF